MQLIRRKPRGGRSPRFLHGCIDDRKHVGIEQALLSDVPGDTRAFLFLPTSYGTGA